VSYVGAKFCKKVAGAVVKGQRLFSSLCEEVDADDSGLLCHTEVS